MAQVDTQTHSGPTQSAATPAPRIAKQAVDVVHGMGEQIPMDTLKGFVRAVWETDQVITANGLPYPAQTWSKPDARTGSLELRRITTRESIKSPPEFPGGVRSDFYELYWADLTAGTRWAEFTSWVRGLLFRSPRRVPHDVFLAWIVLWIAAALVTLLAIVPLAPERVWKDLSPWPWLVEWRWLIIALAAALGTGIHSLATKSFGRVVRYTRADPANIAAREAVRKRGLALLTALHEGAEYQRIVIVAHSLGTILALDLLSYFWARRDSARTIKEGTPEFAALCALETAASRIDRHVPDPQQVHAYFAAQRQLRRILAARSMPDTRWLISDFITLGSPLTHAEFLLAYDEKDLRTRIVGREIPESPPFREELDPKNFQRAKATNALPVGATAKESFLMSFPLPSATDLWQLHHAAPFAAVRWTNLYDPARLVFFGDVIGGKLADALGPAIVDVDLRKLHGRQSWRFTHTLYWAQDGGTIRLQALREAVNLLDRPAASHAKPPHKRPRKKKAIR